MLRRVAFLFRKSACPPVLSTVRPSPTRFRPAVERLDARIVPSTVTVESLGDVTEGGTTTFRLTRADTTGQLLVGVSFGGTADALEYGLFGTQSSILGTTVRFAAGAATADVTVTPDDDSTAEPTEFISLTLLSGSGYTVGTPDSATVNILDNDTPELSVSAVANATEGGTAGLFRVSRLGNLAVPLTANVSVGGTAVPGTDFAPLGAVAFAAGAATVDLPVAAIDNIGYAGPRAISLTLTSGTEYTVGGGSSASVSIIEDEGAPVYWIGDPGDSWTDPTSWSSGAVPDATTAVYFDGSISNGVPVWSNEDATTPGVSSGLQLAELHVVNNYLGTITLTSNMTVGKLELDAASATIDQPSAAYGSDLTVTKMMVWKAGTLNSTAHDATLYLSGAQSIIDPGNGNTITSGSALDLGANSSTTFSAGIVNFINGSPITINANAMMRVNAPANATAEFTSPAGTYDNGKAKITLKANGVLTVKGPGTWAAKNRTFVNDGGSLTISGGATASFGLDALAGPIAGTPLVTDILQSSGTITIHSGCTLTSSWGVMHVKDGTLYAAIDGGTSGTTCTIGCQFTFSGGQISMLDKIGTLQIGTNNITADFYWLGGTFVSHVDCAANGSADSINVIKGKMVVGGSAAISVVTLNSANGVGAGFSRTVVFSKKAIESVPPNQAPSIGFQGPMAPALQLQIVPGHNLASGYVYVIPSP